jgi:dihydrolipoamide dehydrogenase
VFICGHFGEDIPMAEVAEKELIVLGAGPGGYAAAFLAADKGMKVTLIDAGEKPGGVCLHRGCIPSKALLHAAKIITEAEDATSWGLKFNKPEIDLNTLRARKDKVVAGLANGLVSLARQRKVEYVVGRATFDSPTSLRMENGTVFRFRKCIVATGSSPAKLSALSLESPRVMDSTGALKLENTPKSLLVVGGGYIGLELGTVYAALGSKVTVVELTGSLLPGVDTDLVKPLHERLKKHVHAIHLNTKVVKIAEVPEGIRATLQGEGIPQPEVTFERVLVSVGRKPNSGGLGLEKAGVRVDEKGFVVVDERRRTTNENIFAIGDVAGEPMLAHKASHEGKLAVEVITGEPAVWDVRAIPAVVFTDPEIAWCGLTETEAKRAGREIQIGYFPWGASGRASTLGRPDGLTKVIVDPQTDRILGVGIVGTDAGELIAEGVVAVEMGATARDLALSIHAHPTLSETIGEAAESLHGMATHLYKPRR